MLNKFPQWSSSDVKPSKNMSDRDVLRASSSGIAGVCCEVHSASDFQNLVR